MIRRPFLTAVVTATLYATVLVGTASAEIHNVRVTLQTTDRSYIMFDGRIQLSGSPQELAENPLARQYYLGEGFTL